MELQFIMDGSADALNGTIWFPNTPSPPYEQLSPVRQNRCDPIATQHAMGYHSAENSLRQDKYNSPKDSPEDGVQIRSSSESPQHLSPSSDNSPNCQQSTLKRRAGEPLSQITELEKKHAKRDGSVGSNGSGQGWSTQVEELAEHLAADFDGSLSALAASDLATAVASYNMSEALLALPSLTVFKQEAPSPENQQNSNLNHVSQRTINSAPTNNVNNSVEADSNNNGQTAASLHQLLYPSNEEYPPTSSSGNHVSSSQQGSELNEDCRFQYVLAAATSIATKVNEETLTYLNQGQSYEIKLKKLGDLSAYRGKILKGHPTFLFQSTIRICFHERRLQYTEREQMLAWQRARPGERLLEVDVPLSYGMVDVCQPSPSNNSVEFMWDPTKEVGVYIKVNCISTEFTPKKHGGEKGVPFRIQVETRLPGGPRLHAASCQVKVFKLKGADRKHKQDRDKILRRPPHEQDKYQPSYDCTVLSDIPLDSLSSSNVITQSGGSPYASTEAISPQSRSTISGNTSPVVAPLALSVSNPGIVPLVPASDAVKENVGTAPALPSPAAILPDQSCIETERSSCLVQLSPDANAAQTTTWLRASRFNAFESTFASFSASDILRLSRDDLIQICGLADGIRLFNALHSKAPTPKLTLYFSLEDNSSLWRVAYLDSLTSSALINKLLNTLSLSHDRLHSVLFLGPQGIHVLVTDELVANMKDESMYFVETIKDNASERYKLLLKPSSRS
ncbi:transcription factor CP2-like protein 1 isoform X1 [Apis mellifera]|uniref:Transcription factor CP2-like protein 1 isoform X1 n=1 Tax=Apis mellifera TaxID=7460 RepID=A0A7M7IJA5_APIME|nr:transcription factor CP2-like protein 1 isoform X1 [Apis mellifera]XP_016771261.2 transcription factor CP2-like protein 1 isoform X1 [Apis mellifera]|eukprot:XP_006558549.2 transcription factor CP2-like protein 1 isoform X1 [Apis mellifera]